MALVMFLWVQGPLVKSKSKCSQAKLGEAYSEAEMSRCSMCGNRQAKKSYGLPVCRRCHKMLGQLNGELHEKEAADPKLKELGERVVREAKDMIWGKGNNG